MPEWLPILSGIILVDLVLSGDNALVIGVVAAGIPLNLRWIAFLVGGGTAIVLRILLTYSVTLLLQIPYIEVLGGLVLIVITTRLLLKRDDDSPGSEIEQSSNKHILKKNNIWGAILTIIIADVTMSVDNVIAIAALAKYQSTLLIIGLLISIVLLLLGSALVSFLVSRLTWLMPLAAIILAITAANMIIQSNDKLNILPNEQAWWPILIYIIVFAGILAFVAIYYGRRRWRKRHSRLDT